MIKRKNIIFLVICGVLAAITIFMTIETVTGSLEMAKLGKSEAELTDQKRSLEESLVKGVSLTELQVKSSEMGFEKPENLVYVTGSLPVANLP